jgi:NADH-quinone oxidoreductase subunit F
MTFEQIRDNAVAEWKALEESGVPRIYVSTAAWGQHSEALKVFDRINEELGQKKIDARVLEVGSFGFCSVEPMVYIAKGNRPSMAYKNVTPEIASLLVTDYVIGDNPHPDLALCTIGKDKFDGIPDLTELTLYKSQVRIAMRNCGYINPGNINDYIANGGYSGLTTALKKTPEEVIQEISLSGLRGRGGAGFSTAAKWRACHDAPGSIKYLVCNANAGDPDAAGDCMLLESDPHSVLEGILIGAYAVESAHGYISINAGFKLAITRLKAALKQMQDSGLLGNNILETNFNFDIAIKDFADTFICGEETALIRSLEGKRGMPYSRPPYPSTSGLEGKPTVINNVETFANVSAILQKGPEWYRDYGTGQSKGTKIFTLSGKVMNKGIIEIPMGTTLRQIVYEIGGGIPNGNEFKAAQIGGPSGGCLSADALDIPIDYENLTTAGAVMGSSSIIVADSDVCMVDLCKHFQSFSYIQSCGECVLCREGTMQIFEVLKDITDGKGKSENIDILLELGEGLKLGSLCALGRTSPNPVTTAINNFREEFVAHIVRKRCPAKVCRKLISFHILGEKCQGCQKCVDVCPASAISGGKQMIHVIDQATCIKCGTCLDTCPSQFNSIVKVSGKQPSTPEKPIPVGSWGQS